MEPTLPSFAIDGVWSRDNTTSFLQDLWATVQRGTADRRSVWNTPTVATLGLAGVPQQRTVVLRAASGTQWTLRFSTDQRSAKCREIRQTSSVAVHVYDGRRRIQVRMSGRATLHTDDALAEAAWAATQPNSRVGYAQNEAPGNRLKTGHVTRLPVGAHDLEARANFAAVVVTVSSIDWLYLGPDGHRRAQFDRRADGTIHGQWIAP